ncbi:hypothetical protein [Pseudorhodoferax sp.]|uniref:hypothetical protein n=1 Tax=Pseudorhodoferax sp. TaxID=1993553 RepID=UPI0039E2D24F
MPWHAEVITITLRRYEAGKSYEARDPFVGVATVQILGGSRAYVSGFLSDGAPIPRQDWLDLLALLRERYGITRVESERHGRASTALGRRRRNDRLVAKLLFGGLNL